MPSTVRAAFVCALAASAAAAACTPVWKTAAASGLSGNLAAAAWGDTAVYAGGYPAGGRAVVYGGLAMASSFQLVEPRQALAGAATITGVLAFGGGLNASLLPSAAVDFYDAATNASGGGRNLLKTARWFPAAAGGKVSVAFVGGTGADGASLADAECVAMTQAASRVAPFPAGTVGVTMASAASSGGLALVGGGLGSDDLTTDQVIILDLGLCAFRAGPALRLSGRRYFMAAAAVGPLYVFAGGSELTQAVPLATIDVFDGRANFGRTSNLKLSTPRYLVSGALLGSGAALFVGGIDAAGAPSAAADIFAGGNVTAAPPAPFAASFMAAAGAGGRATFGGGFNAGTPSQAIGFVVCAA